MKFFNYVFGGGLEDDLKSAGRQLDRQVIRPIANTVDQVMKNPQALAALSIAIAAPGLGATIGNSILGTITSGAISQTAATAVGNFVLQSAISGNPEQALKNVGGSLIGAGISEALSGQISSVLGSDSGAQLVSRMIGDAADIAVRGGNSGDISKALTRSAIGAGFDRVTQEIPAFQELPLMAKGFARNVAIQSAMGNLGNANFDVMAAITNAAKESIAEQAINTLAPEVGLGPGARKAAMDFVTSRIDGADIGKAAFSTLTNSLKDELRGVAAADKSLSRIFKRDLDSADLNPYVGLPAEEVQKKIQSDLLAGDLPGLDNPDNDPAALRAIDSYRNVASKLTNLVGDDSGEMADKLQSAAFNAVYDFDRDNLKSIVQDTLDDSLPDYLKNRGIEDALISNILNPRSKTDVNLDELFAVRPGEDPENPMIFDSSGVRQPSKDRASNDDIAQLAAQILGDPTKIGWQQYYGKTEEEVANLMRQRASSVDDALEAELGRVPTLEERYNYYKQPLDSIDELIDQDFLRPEELGDFFQTKLNRPPTQAELDQFGDETRYLGKGSVEGVEEADDLLSYVDKGQRDLAKGIASQMGIKSDDVLDQIYQQIQKGNFEDFPSFDQAGANPLSDEYVPRIYQNNELREPDDSRLTMGEYEQMLSPYFGSAFISRDPAISQAIQDGRITERQAAEKIKEQFRGYNEDFIDQMGRAATTDELGQVATWAQFGPDRANEALKSLYNLPSEKQAQFKSVFGRDPTEQDIEQYDLGRASSGTDERTFEQNLKFAYSNEQSTDAARKTLIDAGFSPELADDLAEQAKSTAGAFGAVTPGKAADAILRDARNAIVKAASDEGRYLSPDEIDQFMRSDKPFTEVIQGIRDDTDKGYTSLTEAEQDLIDAGFSPEMARLYKYRAVGEGDGRAQKVIDDTKRSLREVASAEGVELTDPELVGYLSRTGGNIFEDVRKEADARYTTRKEAYDDLRAAGFSPELADSLADGVVGVGGDRSQTAINEFKSKLDEYGDEQGYEITPEQMAEYLKRPVKYDELLKAVDADIEKSRPADVPYDEEAAQSVAEAQKKFIEAPTEEETGINATPKVTSEESKDVGGLPPEPGEVEIMPPEGAEDEAPVAPIAPKGTPEATPGEASTTLPEEIDPVEQDLYDKYLEAARAREAARESGDEDEIARTQEEFFSAAGAYARYMGLVTDEEPSTDETDVTPPYTPGEDAGEFEGSGGEGAADGTPPYTPGEDAKEFEPPYTPGEDETEFVPPYTPGEDAKEFVPPYTPGEDAEEFVPPYTPGEDAAKFVPPYTPGEDAAEFVPPYTPGEDAAEFVPPYTPGEDAEEFVPPYTPGEDAEEFVPPYTPGEDAEEFIPPYTPGEDAAEFIPPYTPGEDAEEFIPPYTPGEDAAEFIPPYTPGEDAEEFIPPYTPGEDAGEFVPDETEPKFNLDDLINDFFKYLKPESPDRQQELDPAFLDWLRRRKQGGPDITKPVVQPEVKPGEQKPGGTGGGGDGNLVPSQQAQGMDMFSLLGLMSLFGGQQPAAPQPPEYKVAELQEPVDFGEIWTPYSDQELKTPYRRV